MIAAAQIFMASLLCKDAALMCQTVGPDLTCLDDVPACHKPAAGQACNEEKLLGHLGVVLYEYLGEEYPEVLGSILGALKSIVNVIGMTKMTPPIKDLLPRLTPILKNRHEKVGPALLHAQQLCCRTDVQSRLSG